MAPNPPFADALARFVLEHAAVRGALVSLDGACREILDCHPYPPPLRHVLAELLAASALLASTLKFKGALIVQLQGDGPVRLLVVECDASLALRATAQWKETAAVLSASASLAELAGGPEHGRLVITLDPKDGGPLYQGVVALEAASVAKLFEHYLRTSEQIDSRMAIAADGPRARGTTPPASSRGHRGRRRHLGARGGARRGALACGAARATYGARAAPGEFPRR